MTWIVEGRPIYFLYGYFPDERNRSSLVVKDIQLKTYRLAMCLHYIFREIETFVEI